MLDSPHHPFYAESKSYHPTVSHLPRLPRRVIVGIPLILAFVVLLSAGHFAYSVYRIDSGQEHDGGGSGGPPPPPPPPSYTLAVSRTGSGSITSNPSGISCGPTCSASYTSGTWVTLTATPAPGWGLASWGGACSGNGGCSVYMNNNQSVTATFVPVWTLGLTVQGTGSVTLAPGGAVCTGNCNFTFLNNTMVTVTPAPGTNFVFSHWSGDCSGSGSCNVTMSANHSVTVTFDPNFTVNITGPGGVTSSPAGISCGGTCTASFPYGTSVTLTATPTGGYIFQGWTGDCSGVGTCVLNATATHNVGAKFGPWLTVTTIGHGTVTSLPVGLTVGPDSSASAPFKSGRTVMLIPASDPGWVFMGWSGACAGSGDCYVSMTGDFSATATFEAQYTMTLITQGFNVGPNYIAIYPGGDACPAVCVRTYLDGTALNLSAFYNSDTAFAGFTGGCVTTNNVCLFTITSDTTVYATFKQLFPLSVSVNGHGSVQSSPSGINCPGTSCSATYADGTSVTLTPTPQAGNVFTGWNGDCLGSGACTVTVDQARNVTANFAASYSLTITKAGSETGALVSSSPGGIDCGSTCTAAFTQGSTITLSVTPAFGDSVVFVTWSGACSGKSLQCTLTMNGNTSVSVDLDAGQLVRFDGYWPGSGTTVLDYYHTYLTGNDGVCTGSGQFYCEAIFPTGANTVIYTTATGPGFLFNHYHFLEDTQPCGGIMCPITVNRLREFLTVMDAMPVQALTVGLNNTGASLAHVISSPAGIDCTTSNPSGCAANFPYNTVVTLTETVDPAAYFAGWGGDCSGTGGCTVTMNVAHSVGADFVVYPVQALNVASNNTGAAHGHIVSSPAGIDCLGNTGTCATNFPYNTVVTLTESSDSSAYFVGWGGDCSGTGPCIVTMNQAHSVGADFLLQPIQTLSVTLGGDGPNAGSVTSSPAGINCQYDPAGCTANFDLGTVVTLTANPLPGSFFSYWSGACTNATVTCTVTMDQARSVGATFNIGQPQTVNVTLGGAGVGYGSVSSSPVGIDCQDGFNNCSTSFAYGTIVTLTAQPAPGSYFDGWSGGSCSGYSTCTLTMDGAKNVMASFYPMPVLTVYVPYDGGRVTSSPAGIDCGHGLPCQAPFPNGTVVTLHATPDAQHYFYGWTSAECAPFGTGDCTLTMNQDRDAGWAVFQPRPLLVLNVHGPGSVSVTPPSGVCPADTTCVYPYEPNVTTTVTLVATPAPGYGIQWGYCGINTTTTCTTSVSGTVTTTIDANFYLLSSVTSSSPTGQTGTIGDILPPIKKTSG